MSDERQYNLIAMHYRLVSLLLPAGEEGVPLALLARSLFPRKTSDEAKAATKRVIRAAGQTIPVFEAGGGRYGMLVEDYVRFLGGFNVPIRGAPGPWGG